MSRETWKSALIGFAICIAFAAIVTGWFAYVVRVPSEWATPSEMRGQAMSVGWMILAVSAIHWLVSATLGKGRVHRLAMPNILLGGGLAMYVAMASNNFYGWSDPNCDQFVQTHAGFDITKVNECPSSSTFFTAVTYLIFGLLLASLVLRVIVSRRRVVTA